MKRRIIFVVVGKFDYEPSTVIGVTTTLRRANFVKEHCITQFNEIEIQSWEVNTYHSVAFYESSEKALSIDDAIKRFTLE